MTAVIFIFNLYYANAEVSFKFGGRLFLDAGTFFNAPKDFGTTAGIPDIRLTGKFYLMDGWSTKLDIGFAGNKIKIKDAFIQKRYKDIHIFRAGYMFGMFGLDQSASTNDFPFMTGSNITETLYPGRRIGASYTYASKRYYTSLALFCGDKLPDSEKIKPGLNSTARFVFRPVDNGEHMLHIGGSCFFRSPDKNEKDERKTLFVSTGNTYLSSPYVFDLELKDTKTQWQWNFELLGLWKRCFIQAEYLHSITTRNSFTANGGYVEGGILLKGENIGYDYTDAIPVCPEKANSIILFSRFNVTDLDHSNINGGKMYDAAVAMNYYLNRNIIFRLNYSHQWTNENTKTGNTNWGNLQARVQFKF